MPEMNISDLPLGPVRSVIGVSEDGSAARQQRSGKVWQVGAFGVTFGRGQDATTMTANRTALAGAIEAVANAGGGWLVIPDIIEVNGYVRLLPKVSLDMRGGGLVNPTMDVINYGVGQILLPGNLHPSHIERFTWYPAVTPTAVTRTLTVTDEGERFSVGDQVMIGSVAEGYSETYLIPKYGWLNVVEAIDGDNITFRHPIDKTGLPLRVSRLADETCLFGLTAFFWQDAEILGGLLETANWHWTSDTAALDCKITGLTSRGSKAIYGNTFQRVTWTNCDFYFRGSVGEQSCLSLDTLVRDCRFTFVGAAGANCAGPSIQEFARRVKYSSCNIDFSAGSLNHAAIRTIDTQDVVFEDIDIFGGVGTAGLSAINIGSAGWATNIDAVFPATGTRLLRVRMNLGSCARYALIGTHQWSYDNGIVDCDFRGPITTTEAIRINAAESTLASNTAAILYGNRLQNGQLFYEGAGTVRASTKFSPFREKLPSRAEVYLSPNGFLGSHLRLPLDSRVLAETGDAWQIVAPGTGDLNHPVTGQGLRVLRRGPLRMVRSVSLSTTTTSVSVLPSSATSASLLKITPGASGRTVSLVAGAAQDDGHRVRLLNVGSDAVTIVAGTGTLALTAAGSLSLAGNQSIELEYDHAGPIWREVGRTIYA